mmetsp:Transcript_16491/g.36333  ORF Transcript_16491/g.36333 Transcript_16491/m.36333 type:complete len:167 (+) Transcript_16491:206-706(+)
MRQRFVFFSAIIILVSNRSSAFLPRRCLLLAVAGMSTEKEENSAASSCAAANDDTKDEAEVLKLPEATNDPSIPSIQLGETISFQEMGPVIINTDGTTRTIDNWDQMSKHEQEVAWKRISKRNEQRRKALLAQEQEQNAGEESNGNAGEGSNGSQQGQQGQQDTKS